MSAKKTPPCDGAFESPKDEKIEDFVGPAASSSTVSNIRKRRAESRKSLAPSDRPPRKKWAGGIKRFKFRLCNNEIVELTTKQRAFVYEYLVDLDVQAAIRRAGYSMHIGTGGHTSPFQYPAVQKAVESELELRARRAQVTQDRVLAEYAKIAFADMSRIMEFKDGGFRVREKSKLSPDDSAAVSEISVTPAGNVRVKLHDKVKALDSLAKHLGMFKEHNKREVTLTLEQLVLSSYSANPALPAPTPPPMQLAEQLVRVEYDKAYGTGNQVVDAIIADEPIEVSPLNADAVGADDE